MTKAQLETAIRTDFLSTIAKMVNDTYDSDALAVSASELAVPVLDAEGNEKFVLIKVSVPRGTRNGAGGYDPYDGYAAADEYALECAERAEKQAAVEAKKQAKLAKAKAKAEAKGSQE